MPDKQQKLDSLLKAAMKIESAEERAEFLRTSCDADSELRAQVEQVLRVDQEAGSLADELSLVIGSAGGSVLQSMLDTVDMPRVVLRNPAGLDSAPRPNSPEIPDRDSDSRYQLDGEIARGGMGAIMRGRDTDLGRDLAIKVLLDTHMDNLEVIHRFVEEAQIGGQLQHPGIAPIYELGQFSDQRPFFAMKLVKGETLLKLLADRDDAADDRGKFLGIFEQMCQTMAYAHARGVIHRDLKPSNIMVGAFGEVQVMDWGLAKVLYVDGVANDKKSNPLQPGQSIISTQRSASSNDLLEGGGSSGGITQMGSVLGTPAYMPMEQALGEIDQLDERADVFGLGAILCEILTGEPPYVAEDVAQVYRQASRGKLEECMARLDACVADDDLIQLTKHCLELEPGARPRDASELAERVTHYLESVEAKLRETEVRRAAEAARAEAEAAQREAEHRRAEAERERADAEGRRLVQQKRSTRQLQRLMWGLAAVLVIAIGTAITAGQFWRVAERNAAAARASEATASAALEQEIAALAAAEDARRIADKANEHAQRQVTRLHVGTGNSFLDGDDHGPALLWLGRAWTSDPDRTDDANHRMRIGQVLGAHPELVGLSILEGAIKHAIIDDVGKWAIARTGRGRAYLCELASGESRSLSDTARVTAIAMRPAGDRAVTGSADATASVWDTASGERLLTLHHGESITGVAIAAEGDLIATVGGKTGLKLWDAVSGAPIKPVPSAPDAYYVIFDPSGGKVLTANAAGFAQVWDTATGEALSSPRPHVAVMDSDIHKGPVFTLDGNQILTRTRLDEEAGTELWLWPAVGGVDPLWGPVQGKQPGFSDVRVQPR